ncbi:MAG: hypothetical protein J6C98_04720 [Oscillospiraceae bacterium]|nr:hypothetical protein [Oscillospiraceae bacterium]
MIIYATKETIERYKLKMPQDLRYPVNMLAQAVIEKESGDRMLQWGAKLFYFDRRKCLQLVHFASKFTLFLIDIKMGDLQDVGNYISGYLIELYKDDQQMQSALERFFSERSMICFSRITDRSIIATLNRNQTAFTEDGYRFYDFIENGILKTFEINRKMNFDWIVTQKVNGKTEYFMPGKKFRELLLRRYSNH